MSKTTKTIKKILIANRGEIACRVIKTARKMGIATVAVYSDADRKALHVRMADEAVHIGASPAIESYLVIEKIVKAAKDTGADAIHPGYGFLSENPDFVRACQKAKITFIGPSPESMEAMGLKDAAKKLMDKAGVPTTPGYHGEDQSPKLLRAKAGMIGYPVLIKAVAGGGGKGMRKVDEDKDFDAALASCQREAKSSFGNDQVLIEKYITSPRHIEVQVFGDSHGNVVHMFERDCSLQRRHQKVIEEAPAPGMTDAVRKAMTDAAINAAKAVDYVGAGTVEFIVDGSGKLRKDGFWFMEMNTRLQVEHPVTEMITGLDLVEWQIRVAQGEKLPKQKDIKMEGHAVEARLYAEDPFNGFLPSTGEITTLDATGNFLLNDGWRIDTGYKPPCSIGIYYDPLIAKIIGFGDDREDAIYETLRGICLYHDEFQNGNISTHFFDKYHEDVIPYDIRKDDRTYAQVANYLCSNTYYKKNGDLVHNTDDNLETRNDVFSTSDGWRLHLDNNAIYRFKRGNEVVEVKILDSHDYFIRVEINEKPLVLYFSSYQDDMSLNAALDHFNAWDFEDIGHAVLMTWNSTKFLIEKHYSTGEALTNTSNQITAPMPGKIIAVNAKAGDTVKAGEPLIVMEAMKMEMTLDAPRDGVVAEVSAEVGALVADGDILLSLEKEE